MRKRARTDRNQEEIVIALRRAGATVQVLSGVHGGCPDVLCGFRGVNHLFEIKDGLQAPSKQKLTPEEASWHSGWNGNVKTVRNIMDALKAIGL
jgi:hypothetical protein